MTDRADLLFCLKALESRLSEQIRKAEETREEIQQIKAQIAALDEDVKATPSWDGPATAAAKVALFMSLFRGARMCSPDSG